MAERALRAGASLRIGSVVESVLVEEGRVSGVAVAGGGGIVGCGQVVAAAGPWTTQLIRRWSGSGLIRSVWGVVVSASLLEPPRHVLEELGIDRPGQPPEEMFSLVTVEGRSSVGSTFLTERPEPMDRVGRIMARAAEFVPGLATLAPAGVRACARPVSFDGRPFIGAIGGIEGLFVCAGHGPWGISTGPASARRLADLMLGRADVDPVFSPMRAVTS
jgi:glycine oxidase